jgi:isopenicillin N synthase-like dioxygenase
LSQLLHLGDHMTQPLIKTVDLQDFLSGDQAQQQHFVNEVGEALHHIGFFVLKNHGVNLDMLDEAFRAAEEFFLLPHAEKIKYEIPGLAGQRGFISFGREVAKYETRPDLKEFWQIGRDYAPDAPQAELNPPNLWPKEVPNFRAIFASMFAQLDACSMHLLEACALFLGEPRDRFSSIARDGQSILRILHYPPVAKGTSGVRSAAHEDINLITLLCQASSGGLEIKTHDGAWHEVLAPREHIIVDTGDMMQNITNGYFLSTTHRVVNPKDEYSRRFSFPFFCHPRAEARLDPIPSCVAKTGGEKKFPDILAGVYLNQRLEEIGLAAKK